MKNAQINKQEYVLKNKDKNIIKFQVSKEKVVEEGVENYIVNISNVEILDEKLLPYNFSSTNRDKLADSIFSWIKARKIPKNREFVQEIIHALQINENDFMAFVDTTLCLSLNDTFWLVPNEEKFIWENYNLYENSFNKTLALVAFTGYSKTANGLRTTPEATTNGALKKCWHKNEQTNKIELLKGQTKPYANSGKEAYCEFYMSQILDALGFEHVKYDLQQFHKELVSSCEIFTSLKYGYIPMGFIFTKSYKPTQTKFSYLNEIAQIYGKEAFEDMLLFDSIIYNTDRHFGNFGMLVDNDTNELVKPAPIFDNGLSFFNFVTEDELDNMENILKEKTSSFDLDFDKQMRYAAKSRHIQALSKILNFTFTRHEKYNLPEKWLKAGEKFIQNRAKKILEIIQDKTRK